MDYKSIGLFISLLTYREMEMREKLAITRGKRDEVPVESISAI
ncbi:hypothetical protein SAMN04487772_11522 [[Clostridium] polysaccharolyticum]|uniref:Uncharacterized protein n=1 Tax=[Clostridium] polysaccharolyticum TaxID=29364 RepID=A0A1I0DJN5_9FIRM|nr:hypothetical protein SAMN04487772_11522 [[Clostridium] polysaccharolyticum]